MSSKPANFMANLFFKSEEDEKANLFEYTYPDQSPVLRPSFSDKPPRKSTHEFKIHIAIDFGTDGTGFIFSKYIETKCHQYQYHKYIALAYAIKGTKDVFAHKQWKSSKFKVEVKPKTVVLLDENHNVVSFGQDAKHMFSKYKIYTQML